MVAFSTRHPETDTSCWLAGRSFRTLFMLNVPQEHEHSHIDHPYHKVHDSRGNAARTRADPLLLSPPRNPGNLSIYLLRQPPQPRAVRLELHQPHHGHHPQGPEHGDEGADVGGCGAGGNAADEIGVKELLDGTYEGLENRHYWAGQARRGGRTRRKIGGKGLGLDGGARVGEGARWLFHLGL